MMRLPVILILCALAFGACATLPSRDRDFLQRHNVTGPVYERMLHQEPLELADIIELSRKHLPSRFIIHYLEGTYFPYALRAEDVLQLQRAGVPNEVIDYLLATPSLFRPDPGYPFDGPYYPSPLIWPRDGDRHRR